MGLYSLNADFNAYTASLPEVEPLAAPDDTVPKVQTRFPVAKTIPEEYEEIGKQSPADLKTPDNVKTTIEYESAKKAAREYGCPVGRILRWNVDGER